MSIGKIIITKELCNIVDTLHSKIGAKEWSGILFYKLVSGKISNLKDLVFEAKYFYPMDIGNTASTEFEYSAELMDVYDIYPDAMNYSIGLLHSHHNLGAFFSGTDMNELKNNSSNYNYYISLVVDFVKTPVCKIGFPVENSIKSSMIDNNGKKFTTCSIKKDIEIFDLDVEYESKVELPWLVSKIAELSRPKIQNIPGINSIFNDTVPLYSEDLKFRSKSLGTPKFISKNTISNEEQFIINLCNLGSHGTTVEEGLLNLRNLSETEGDLFVEALDTNLEDIYFSTFDTTLISSVSILRSLEVLIQYEDEFSKDFAYESIKESLMQYI